MKPVCHDEERLALLQFKQSFALNLLDSTCSGASPKLSSWKIEDGNGNCCSWDGVECDDDAGYVVGLDLSSSCLYGSIDSNTTLFQLFHLQNLNLADNNFNHSQIPEAIQQLSKLRYLNLSSSQFSGQIPYSISKFHDLKVIDLSDNIDIFSGKPLLELKNPDMRTLLLNLTSLESLDLTLVTISSTVPDFLTNFSSLKFFILSQYDLQGKFPEKIFQLKSLKSIYLFQNPHLYGYLPEFNSSSPLEEIMLYNNGFYGEIPFSMANLLSLKALVLVECKFSGPIPFFLGNHTELQILGLGLNWLSGPATSLSWLGKLNDLLLLDLEGMNLDKNALSYLGNLTKLTHLSVSDNSITAHIPSSIYNMSSLVVLMMDNNDMIGELPHWLGNFSTSLVFLSLKGNKFQGRIPDTFRKENNLKFIDLSSNQLQGLVPRSLSNCRMIELIVLGSNQLNDVFPFWLGSLPHLRVLILQSNKFHGAIGEPKSQSQFPKLHIIDLSYNNFSHNLPFGYIKNWNAMKTFSSRSTYLRTKAMLGSPFFMSFNVYYSITIISKGTEINFQRIQEVFTVIDLSCNRFEGEIPYFIADLKGLQLLNLSHNMLTGPIPPSIANMMHLESLDLSHNKLSGNIPPQLSKLTFLAIFNVSYNNLSGPIPEGNQLDTMENSSYVGNSGLCGTPLSKKCWKSKTVPSPISEQEKDEQSSVFEFGWKIVLIGYGCGMVFGMVLGNYIIEWKKVWFFKIFRMTSKKRPTRLIRR